MQNGKKKRFPFFVEKKPVKNANELKKSSKFCWRDLPKLYTKLRWICHCLCSIQKLSIMSCLVSFYSQLLSSIVFLVSSITVLLSLWCGLCWQTLDNFAFLWYTLQFNCNMFKIYFRGNFWTAVMQFILVCSKLARCSWLPIQQSALKIIYLWLIINVLKLI